MHSVTKITIRIKTKCLSIFGDAGSIRLLWCGVPTAASNESEVREADTTRGNWNYEAR